MSKQFQSVLKELQVAGQYLQVNRSTRGQFQQKKSIWNSCNSHA